ncbi:hypothetical protein ACVW0Y_004382 [Pseudomonas sp. TE3786]
MESTLEMFFSYLGMAACIGAAGHLFFTGNKTVAALLVAGFILHLQAALYVTFIDQPFGEGGCWLEKTFYQCLPLGQKLSIHAAQLGHYLIAAGVFLLARAARRNA